jgi:inosine/xanthosine triphosphatase
MIVAVGSTNPVKIHSVTLAFNRVWPTERWVIEKCAVESGVSSQPLVDNETIEGARNRAVSALEYVKADFGVGVEGGLQQTDDRWFASVWVVVANKHGEEGIGAALKVAVPPKIMLLVHEGLELGEACDRIFEKQNSKQGEGIFGLLTNGQISRISVSTDAVIAALASFMHPSLAE